MKEPKQACRDRNMYSYQSYKGAEAMAEDIKKDVTDILLVVGQNEKALFERIQEYFDLTLP